MNWTHSRGHVKYYVLLSAVLFLIVAAAMYTSMWGATETTYMYPTETLSGDTSGEWLDHVAVLDANGEFNASKYVDDIRQMRLLDAKTDEYFVPRWNKVNVHEYTMPIDGRSICEGEAPFLLVVIPSVDKNWLKRREIRKTWGSVVKTGVWADGSPLPRIKLVFFFGRNLVDESLWALRPENFIYGDVVLIDFLESYRNLTVKIISAMNWVSKYCSGVKYILKTDDDTFVHLPRLIKIIQNVDSRNSFIGRQQRRLTPVRGARKEKWLVSKDEYLPDTFPLYVSGASYVVPGHFAAKLFHVSQYLPYLPIEDVFITGMLRTAVGARLKDIGLAVCLQPEECNMIAEDHVVSVVGFKGYQWLWWVWQKVINK